MGSIGVADNVVKDESLKSSRFDVEVPLQHIGAPKPGEGGYQSLNPRSETLPKGWQYEPTSRPLPSEVLVEHDFGVKVRDGATLYSDIYRPVKLDKKVPAIICWGPFGKKFNGISSLKLMTPWNLGIPDGTLSGLEKFEAPDPADCVPRGYAVVNVDSRGCGDSEGVMCIIGSQEAEDGYDVIEAIAKLPWCNGNVGLAGNSHLAIIQWHVAALRPPSLRAIAPWEGCGDLYREQFARGGIYGGDLFDNLIAKYMLKGHHGMESFRQMYQKHPLMNSWWADKRPNMANISIPTYITGTWSNTMHGMGAIRGWQEVNTDKKWLRWHGTQEWADMWGNRDGVEELFSFFDRYLKGVNNDWESTPKVRMAVLRFGEQDAISNISVPEFPLPQTQYRKFYLSTHNKLSPDDGSLPDVQISNYASQDHSSFARFNYTFTRKTTLLGISKALLFMSCPDKDDMDVYVILRKISRSGEPLLALNIPWSSSIPVQSIADIPADKRTEVILYTGAIGQLRASHRAIDASKSMHGNWPFHPHDREEKVPAGEVVRLEIGIWATGIRFEEGEGLEVRVGGVYPGINNFGTDQHSVNKGEHRVHFGGEYDSHVVLPFVELDI